MVYRIVAIPPLTREGREILRDYSVAYFRRNQLDEAIKALSEGAEILIFVGFKVGKEVMDKAPKLKLIITRTSGVDDIDLNEAEERGICVANQPEVIAESVAEHAIGSILASLKFIVAGHEYVTSGAWEKEGWPHWFRGGLILGRTLGLIGAGRIGTLIASKAKCLGILKIYYWSRSRKPYLEMSLGAEKVPFNEIFSSSQILVNTLPQTPQTENLITLEHLMKLPQNAVFVNVGRGKTVEEGAIEKLLEVRQDVRVILDVYREEPLKHESCLIKKYGEDPRVILTPHIAGYSEESYRGTSYLAALQAVKYLEEGCVWNPVTAACRSCRNSPPPLEEVLRNITIDAYPISREPQ